MLSCMYQLYPWKNAAGSKTLRTYCHRARIKAPCAARQARLLNQLSALGDARVHAQASAHHRRSTTAAWQYQLASADAKLRSRWQNSTGETVLALAGKTRSSNKAARRECLTDLADPSPTSAGGRACGSALAHISGGGEGGKANWRRIPGRAARIA